MIRRFLTSPGGLQNFFASTTGGTSTINSGSLPNSKLLLGGVRTSIRRARNFEAKKDPEGIKYHGFTYFPRYPNQVDPPYTPTKLFRVTLVMPTRGTPRWDKKVLGELGLFKKKTVERREKGTRALIENQAHGYKYKVAILANTPSNCALLYRVKHLIEIQPISFPHGEPTDPSQGFLKENGEYVTYNTLESPRVDIEEGENDVKALRKISVDKNTLKQRLKYNWHHKF